MGVSLGEPEADVLKRLGETGFIIFPNGLSGTPTTISYQLDHTHGTLQVDFYKDRVEGINLGWSMWDHSVPSGLADPYGVTLAMNAAQLQALRGKSEKETHANGRTFESYGGASGTEWTYDFMDGSMENIRVEEPKSVIDAMPAAPPVVMHSGASLGDALLNGAADEESGARNEYFYLISIRCVGGAPIPLEQAQSLIRKEGREYDRLDLSCPIAPNVSQMYFDVTPFFGKT